MSRHTSGRVAAVGALVVAVALDLVAIGLFAAVSADLDVLGTLTPALFVWQLLMVVPFAIVGAVVATRRPSNVIGWLLLATGVLIGLHVASRAYLAWEALDGQSGPAAPAMLVVGTAAFYLTSGVVAPRLLLLFPDGDLPSPRWRIVNVAQAVGVGALVVLMLTPGDHGTRSGVENPLGIEGWRVLEGVSLGLLDLIVNALVVVGGASLVVRFRRSEGIERAQLKWMAWAGSLAGVALIGYTALSPVAPWTNPITQTLGGLAALLVVIALGIALLRYRLYEIDRLISRTIGWAIISGTLVIAFVVPVLGLQALLAPITAGNSLAVAVSTLFAAGLFGPLRTRVQRAVDRRFDRSRHDGERLVAAFGERLRDEVDLVAIERDLQDSVDAAVRPSSVGVWLRPGPGGPS